MVSKSISCLGIALLVGALESANSGQHVPASTPPPAAVHAVALPLTLHGTVHESNGGPIAGVRVGPDAGSGTMTDTGGEYQLPVSTIPPQGLYLSLIKPGHETRRLRLATAAMSPGEVGDLSLELDRHVAADRPLSFALTNDDARIGDYVIGQYVCDPCVPIVVDDAPADGLRIHVEWTGPVPLTAFLEGADVIGDSYKVSMTIPALWSTEVDVDIPVDWSTQSTGRPLLKVGFRTGGHAAIAAPIPVRVSVVGPHAARR